MGIETKFKVGDKVCFKKNMHKIFVVLETYLGRNILGDADASKTLVALDEVLVLASDWQPKFSVGDIVKYKAKCGFISNALFRVAGIIHQKHLYALVEIDGSFNHICHRENETWLELVSKGEQEQNNNNKMEQQQTPKKQLEKAKSELAEKLLPFIEEFENKTGFNVSNIVMNKKTVLSNDDHHITRVWLDINVDI